MMLMVLGNISCDLDPLDFGVNVKGQIMYFHINVSP